MPRVINQDPAVLKRATCYSCGAVNEYAPREVRVLWSGKDYGGGPDGAKGFDCAGCGNHVILERW